MFHYACGLIDSGGLLRGPLVGLLPRRRRRRRRRRLGCSTSCPAASSRSGHHVYRDKHRGDRECGPGTMRPGPHDRLRSRHDAPVRDLTKSMHHRDQDLFVGQDSSRRLAAQGLPQVLRGCIGEGQTGAQARCGDRECGPGTMRCYCKRRHPHLPNPHHRDQDLFVGQDSSPRVSAQGLPQNQTGPSPLLPLYISSPPHRTPQQRRPSPLPLAWLVTEEAGAQFRFTTNLGSRESGRRTRFIGPPGTVGFGAHHARRSAGHASEAGGQLPPFFTDRISSTVRGQSDRFSTPSARTKTSSSSRTPPLPGTPRRAPGSKSAAAQARRRPQNRLKIEKETSHDPV